MLISPKRLVRGSQAAPETDGDTSAAVADSAASATQPEAKLASQSSLAQSALLIVPPFCSPNYTYPAPAYLARFLKRRGYKVAQADINLELMLKIFCRSGLTRIFNAIEENGAKKAREEGVPLSENSQRTLALKNRYISTVDSVIRFLQGRDPSIAYRICQTGFLPRGPHFAFNQGFDAYDGNGNTLAVHDRAKFVGTLYLYDIAELIREAIFPYFQITLVDRYYDSFVHACTTFEKMEAELEREPNIVDDLLLEVLDDHIEKAKPDLVGVTVPFARNLYWAFRIGKRTKEWHPDARVAMGGGFFNTSMREQKDARVFNYVDFLSLDDGEKPILDILEYMAGKRDVRRLKRTWHRENDAMIYEDGDPDGDVRHSEAGAPDYEGYRVSDYFSSLETNNINQRVRSDGWWNKMTMTHGCYWKKCSFCDIHLSYVGDYDTATAKNLVDKVEEAIAATGHTGFHFVDEAMPPKVMRDFAIEILRRDLHISWHGMLRFDKAFTPELCKLLAASGLVVVMGGLEVASNRLLELMKKGTTVEQVARVAKNFKDAGVKVHAYIMYGFPTQTDQETIDALDVVRQLFKYGLLTSASWAKFGVTPHSPIGRNPEEYKIQLLPMPEGAFVEQIIPHLDPLGADHERYTKGLMSALKYYGLGFHHDAPSEGWFDFAVPSVSIDRDLIGKVLAGHTNVTPIEPGQRDRRVMWLGARPQLRMLPWQDGRPLTAELVIQEASGTHALTMPAAWGQWLLAILDRVHARADYSTSMKDLEESWDLCIKPLPGVQPSREAAATTFEAFLKSDVWRTLQEHGLILTAQQKRVIWMGPAPTVKELSANETAVVAPAAKDPAQAAETAPASDIPAELHLAHDEKDTHGLVLRMPTRWAHWLADVLRRSQPDAPKIVDLAELKRSWASEMKPNESFQMPFTDQVPFREFMHSPVWRAIRERGLALL